MKIRLKDNKVENIRKVCQCWILPETSARSGPTAMAGEVNGRTADYQEEKSMKTRI